MSPISVIVMNISHMYEDYEFLHASDFVWLDLTDIMEADGYCSGRAQKIITERIKSLPRRAVHLLDNGNYHYLTDLWCRSISEKFNLLLFDHHPDTQKSRIPSMLSCGSWVRHMLGSHPYLQKVYMVGPSSGKLDFLNGYKGRIVLVKDLSLIPHDFPIYISVDLDILDKKYFISNWDQGTFSFDQLYSGLSFLLEFHRPVLGVDLCGDDDRAYHLSNEQVYFSLIDLLVNSL